MISLRRKILIFPIKHLNISRLSKLIFEFDKKLFKSEIDEDLKVLLFRLHRELPKEIERSKALNCPFMWLPQNIGMHPNMSIEEFEEKILPNANAALLYDFYKAELQEKRLDFDGIAESLYFRAIPVIQETTIDGISNKALDFLSFGEILAKYYNTCLMREPILKRTLSIELELQKYLPKNNLAVLELSSRNKMLYPTLVVLLHHMWKPLVKRALTDMLLYVVDGRITVNAINPNKIDDFEAEFSLIDPDTYDIDGLRFREKYASQCSAAPLTPGNFMFIPEGWLYLVSDFGVNTNYCIFK